MLRLNRKSAFVISLATSLFAGTAFAQAPAAVSPAQTSAAPTAPRKASQHHSAKHNKTPAPVQEVAPPPPPPTPEQMAPVPPNVSFQAGQLSIQSNNATLAQVLRSVQAKTGASFEIPASANNDRVVAQLGPGQPRDVLAALLNGSKFNYIILGSSDQPGSVQKVILTPRQNIPTTTNTAQNRPTPQAQEPQPDEDYTPPEPVEDNSANQPQPGAFRPGANGPIPGSQNDAQENNGQQQQGVKTPEQLLQELQRMQQQQQLYQQQLNPANQNPQPQ
jgi:hypothetical protein